MLRCRDMIFRAHLVLSAQPLGERGTFATPGQSYSAQKKTYSHFCPSRGITPTVAAPGQFYRCPKGRLWWLNDVRGVTAPNK